MDEDGDQIVHRGNKKSYDQTPQKRDEKAQDTNGKSDKHKQVIELSDDDKGASQETGAGNQEEPGEKTAMEVDSEPSKKLPKEKKSKRKEKNVPKGKQTENTPMEDVTDPQKTKKSKSKSKSEQPEKSNVGSAPKESLKKQKDAPEEPAPKKKTKKPSLPNPSSFVIGETPLTNSAQRLTHDKEAAAKKVHEYHTTMGKVEASLPSEDIKTHEQLAKSQLADRSNIISQEIPDTGVGATYAALSLFGAYKEQIIEEGDMVDFVPLESSKSKEKWTFEFKRLKCYKNNSVKSGIYLVLVEPKEVRDNTIMDEEQDEDSYGCIVSGNVLSLCNTFMEFLGQGEWKLDLAFEILKTAKLRKNDLTMWHLVNYPNVRTSIKNYTSKWKENHNEIEFLNNGIKHVNRTREVEEPQQKQDKTSRQSPKRKAEEPVPEEPLKKQKHVDSEPKTKEPEKPQKEAQTDSEHVKVDRPTESDAQRMRKEISEDATFSKGFASVVQKTLKDFYPNIELNIAKDCTLEGVKEKLGSWVKEAKQVRTTSVEELHKSIKEVEKEKAALSESLRLAKEERDNAIKEQKNKSSVFEEKIRVLEEELQKSGEELETLTAEVEELKHTQTKQGTGNELHELKAQLETAKNQKVMVLTEMTAKINAEKSKAESALMEVDSINAKYGQTLMELAAYKTEVEQANTRLQRIQERDDTAIRYLNEMSQFNHSLIEATEGHSKLINAFSSLYNLKMDGSHQS